MARNEEVSAAFLEFSRSKLLKQYWPRLRGCLESLSDEQIWWRPNKESNSLGNLVLHLNGNVRQWMVASFNKQEDLRDRPSEFAENAQPSGAQLIEILGNTMQEASQVLSKLTTEELLAPYHIQGTDTTGLDAVYQVVEHFGLHYGQAVYITKLLLGDTKA